MKLLVILGLMCSPAFGAIAYVSASHTVCLQATASAGAACTLTASTTAGNAVVVAMAIKTATRTLTNMVGSASTAFFIQATPVRFNGSNDAVVISICMNCAALTSVTPTLSGTSVYALAVEEYSGVGALGAWTSKTGTSTAPTSFRDPLAPMSVSER